MVKALEITLVICTVFLILFVVILFYFYFTLKLQVPILVQKEQEKWHTHLQNLDKDWRQKQEDWQQRSQKSNDEFHKKVLQIQQEAIEQAEKLFLSRRDEERKILYQEAETYATRVLSDKEKEIRGDAINRSQSVIIGKVSEHFVPFLPQSNPNLNPKEFRFIGNPIDFVVFCGLYDEDAEISKWTELFYRCLKNVYSNLMKKKYIKLDEAEKTTLQEGHKNGKITAFQKRCHCLLLSSEGYEVKELARVLRVSEISIYAWFKRWETSGIVGLRDKPRGGRRAILQPEDLAQVKERVQENAQRLKIAREKLKEDLGREFSTRTLKRFLKSLIADTSVGANV